MNNSRSDLSGNQFNPDGESSATIVFPDGDRREIKLTLAEAERLRRSGLDKTSRWARMRSSTTTRGVAKFLATAISAGVIAALTAGWIGDSFADRQLEVTLEVDLVKETSEAALAVHQQAQNASRLGSDPVKQREARDAAADTWVERTQGTITPRFESYYGEDAVVTENWYDYQDAVYTWAVMACCTRDEASRLADVNKIRAYVESHTDLSNAPSDEDWTSLTVNEAPPGAAYQRVGLALLRGRGSLMNDLREASPQLD